MLRLIHIQLLIKTNNDSESGEEYSMKEVSKAVPGSNRSDTGHSEHEVMTNEKLALGSSSWVSWVKFRKPD